MRFALLLFPVIIFAGCKGEPGPAGPPGGPVLTGNIRGTIILYDDSYPPLRLEDASGVTISLLPISVTTLSQQDGSWELAGVPAGIYSFKFSKPGYFIHNRYNVQFVGSGTYYTYTEALQQVPSVSVQQFFMRFNDTSSAIVFTGTLGSADSTYREVTILMSMTTMDDATPFEFDTYTYAYANQNSVNFSREYYISSSSQLSGSTVYAKAFANARYTWYPDADPGSQRYQFDTPGVLFSVQRNLDVP